MLRIPSDRDSNGIVWDCGCLWFACPPSVCTSLLSLFYLYIYVMYIHTHIHTYIHTYIHTCIHTYVRTYVRTYLHTYLFFVCVFFCFFQVCFAFFSKGHFTKSLRILMLLAYSPFGFVFLWITLHSSYTSFIFMFVSQFGRVYCQTFKNMHKLL